MTKYTKFVWPLLWILCLFIVIPSCSEDAIVATGVSYSDVPNYTPPVDNTPTELDPLPDADIDIKPADNPDVPEEGWQAVLLPSMATDVDLAFTGQTRLKVVLISTLEETSGDGVVGETINWGIESGDASISLTSKKSATGEGGFATVNVKSKQVVGEAFVYAQSRIAPKTVRFRINVLDKPTGKLSISTSYKGSAPVTNYSIRLYDYEDVFCDNNDFSNGVYAEPLFPAIDEKRATFENLQVGQKFTAIAYGYADNGAPVAVGCLDTNLKIYENQTTEALIVMDTINLDISTTYHVRSYFDLGDVVAALGDFGEAVKVFNSFVDNPAGFLYDKIVDLLGEFLPAWIVDGVAWLVDKLGFKSLLTNWVNEKIASNSTMCMIGTFACQLRNIVRFMEFTGNVEIQRVRTIEIGGTNAYNGLAVYWRFNCPSDDVNCGRYSFSVEELKLGADLNFLEGSWQGGLSNGYDRFLIDNHQLKFKYGKIIMHLINYLLIPKVTNDNIHSIEAALRYWINADDFANWMHEKIKFGTWQLSLENANTIVNSILKIFNFVDIFASIQEAGANVVISGSGQLKDSNADNVVDIIEEGIWNGNMSIQREDGTQVTAVRGIWSAYNKKNRAGDDNTMFCTYPKTIDADARQCDFPDIDYSKLNSSNMCEKFAKCGN